MGLLAKAFRIALFATLAVIGAVAGFVASQEAVLRTMPPGARYGDTREDRDWKPELQAWAVFGIVSGAAAGAVVGHLAFRALHRENECAAKRNDRDPSS
jgi:hypothetical protein